MTHEEGYPGTAVWPAAGPMDTEFNLPGPTLRIPWAEIANGRAAPPGVVEALDVVEHIGERLVARTVDTAAYPLGFQR